MALASDGSIPAVVGTGDNWVILALENRGFITSTFQTSEIDGANARAEGTHTAREWCAPYGIIGNGINLASLGKPKLEID